MFLSFFIRPRFGHLRQVLQQVRDGISDPYLILNRSPADFHPVPLEMMMQFPLLMQEGVCRMATHNRPWFSYPFRQYRLKFLEEGSWKIEMVGPCSRLRVLDGLVDIISSLFGKGSTVHDFTAWRNYHSLNPGSPPILHRWSIPGLPVITLYVSPAPQPRILLLIHFCPADALQI